MAVLKRTHCPRHSAWIYRFETGGHEGVPFGDANQRGATMEPDDGKAPISTSNLKPYRENSTVRNFRARNDGTSGIIRSPRPRISHPTDPSARVLRRAPRGAGEGRQGIGGGAMSSEKD